METGSSRETKVIEFKARLEEYKSFLKNAQDNLNRVNDKLTNFLTGGLVVTVLETYKGGGYYGIYAFSAKEGKLTNLLAGTGDRDVRKTDAIDITEKILQQFDRKTEYESALQPEIPYLTDAGIILDIDNQQLISKSGK